MSVIATGRVKEGIVEISGMKKCIYCLGAGRVYNYQWRAYRTCLVCKGSGRLGGVE